MSHVLHFDCFSGISGDMTVAALVDLGVPLELLDEAIGSLDLNAKLMVEPVRRGGFAARRVSVEAPHEHVHRHLSDVFKILDRGRLSDRARSLARRMFELLADVEAACHGTTRDKVHFHEVGAIDSIVDFAAVAVGVDWLGPERVTCGPVPTGRGWVECAHGRLPVPAPAVARLLEGVPLAACEIGEELTTPTGATILKVLVNEFVSGPRLTIEKTGLGAGSRELAEQPNLLRLFWGTDRPSTPTSPEGDSVWQVETNLDDVPGEIVGYALERLFQAGALDAYTLPISMKKNRPGVLLAALCPDSALPAVERAIFEETGTFGIRKMRCERTRLDRKQVEVTTPWGPVKGKLGWNGNVRIFTPEFDDCARVARRYQVPLRTVYRTVVSSFSAAEDPSGAKA